MNVLFLLDNPPLPMSGGVETVVSILSEAFRKEFGWNCHSVFFRGDCENAASLNMMRVNLDNCEPELANVISDYDIDVILNNVMSKQTAKSVFPALVNIREKSCPKIKHVFIYHSCPGYELVKQDLSFLCKKMWLCGVSLDSVKVIFSQTLLRIVPMSFLRKIVGRKYVTMTLGVDKVVCLSKKLEERFGEYSGFPLDSITNVANPVSLNSSTDAATKEKIVLIVSRLDETSKRLTSALKVWKMLEGEAEVSGWKLVVVGDGPDRIVYEKIAKDYKLNNIRFEGRQNPISYYRSASLFMMTSRFEGFPMTILEAQQNGVVVVGLKSEHFPTLLDFIDDGETGFIVQSMNGMVETLKKLMSNDSLRASVATHAKDNLVRYDLRITLGKWKTLCESLQNPT